MNAFVQAQTEGMPFDRLDQRAGQIPYIAIQAFCQTTGFTASVRGAAVDRRLSRAQVEVSTGGLREATRFYADKPTPDLLLIETGLPEDELVWELDALAEVCDANTRVVLAGATNDIMFYRRLVERGITEYLVTPGDPLTVIDAVMRLFPQEAAARMGKVFAFMGAKGGVGSSAVAQNVAWALGDSGSKVLLADLDLQFGTAALNYNIDAPSGFTELLDGADRLDDALFERLLHKRGANLRVLAGATAAREAVQPDLRVLDLVLERARATFPFVVLDLAHQWSPWVRQALLCADEVVVTVQPDLANLRNARMLFEILRAARPNDAEPRLVVNQAGMPKRTEIKAEEFAAALAVPVTARVDFQPALFSKAANAGEMVAEVSKASAQRFLKIAHECSGKPLVKKPRRLIRWR